MSLQLNDKLVSGRFVSFQGALESLDPIGFMGVNVTSAGLSAQYEKMWRVSFVGSTVEGDVEAMQVSLLLQHAANPHFTPLIRARDIIKCLVYNMHSGSWLPHGFDWEWRQGNHLR